VTDAPYRPKILTGGLPTTVAYTTGNRLLRHGSVIGWERDPDGVEAYLVRCTETGRLNRVRPDRITEVRP
jgi:hypothetical protein